MNIKADCIKSLKLNLGRKVVEEMSLDLQTRFYSFNLKNLEASSKLVQAATFAAFLSILEWGSNEIV